MTSYFQRLEALTAARGGPANLAATRRLRTGAEALRGTAEQLLVAGLEQLGMAQSWQAIPLDALPGVSGAVACNATGLWPLARIGEVAKRLKAAVEAGAQWKLVFPLMASERASVDLDDPEQGVEHDIAFHVAIAAATHNRYYQDLLQYLNLQLRLAVSTARSNSRRQAGLTAAVHQEHVAVFEAISAGDAERARLAATRHLQQAASRLNLELFFPAARQTS